jgi:hypothetical protein
MDNRYRQDWEEYCLPFLPPSHIKEDELPKREPDPDDISWDTVPYAPRVGLEAVPITFAEFASPPELGGIEGGRCPEAKFVSYNDGSGLTIGGREGTRRVFGMLLMTLGMVEMVKLAHPRSRFWRRKSI